MIGVNLFRRLDGEARRNEACKFVVDLSSDRQHCCCKAKEQMRAYKVQVIDHLLLNRHLIALSQLETKCLNDVLLLHIGHRVPKQRRLTVVVAELGASDTLFDARR